MRVKNRKCIRRLSFKSLWASRKRNIIAICAIALTTLMFTSLFTIILSVNSSYETYNFRQAGGYSDGIFKDLSREQTDKIAAHKGIKASGERIVCGFSSSDVFGKVAAEVSYMDKNCTKWSYATPTTGKEPQKENEIAMDTTALRLLGVEPKLGTNVTITYQAGNGTDTGIPQTDSFILVGYWEYDDLMPVHYINVSKAYVDKINEKCIAAGDEALDIDLNVMLPSKLNIREQMEKIDTDLGYDWNTRDQENSARIGVNWGLTASSVSSDIDFSLVAAILDLVVGVLYGAVSALFGGKVDAVMQRIIEVLVGIPSLIIVILFLMAFPAGVGTIIAALSITGWVNMARLVRAEILKLKNQEFVLASQVLGTSKFNIIMKDLIPNTVSVIVINVMFTIPSAIFTEAFLSFIGIGLAEPQASLGVLINGGYQVLRMYPHVLIFPAIVIVLIMVCFSILGDGLRDALDPQMRK